MTDTEVGERQHGEKWQQHTYLWQLQHRQVEWISKANPILLFRVKYNLIWPQRMDRNYVFTLHFNSFTQCFKHTLFLGEIFFLPKKIFTKLKGNHNSNLKNQKRNHPTTEITTVNRAQNSTFFVLWLTALQTTKQQGDWLR